MAGMEQFKEHFVLLLEAGFIAVNHADEDAAMKLFKASQLLKPENTLPMLGLGYMHLHKLELKQASEIFKKIIQKDPSNQIAKALLGMSLSMMTEKVSEGEKVLEDVAMHADDPQIKHLAEDTITFVERFVKKPLSPADLPHENKKKQ